MLLSKFVEVIIYAGAVQGFFLALVLTAGKKGNGRSNKILSVLLIILSLSIIHLFFVSGSIGFPYKIKEPFILLIGPSLLLYIRELTSPRKLVLTDVLHLIPFFLFFIIHLPAAISGADSVYGTLLFKNSFAVSIGIWALVVIQYGYYWWKIVHIINDHRATIETEFSNTEGKTLSWMKIFLHVFGMFFLLLVITLGLTIHRVDYTVVDAVICLALSFTIFALGYEGLLQDEIFSNISLSEPAIIPDNIKKQDIPKLSDRTDSEAMQNLLNYMNGKKPYLEETLSLTDLAGQLNMTRNQLSELINKNTGDNFYMFVNKFRVEEVKRLISDPKNKNFTILSLAYEAGFPSKSSFHTIFKKFTGLTPTEYRSELQ